VVDLFLILDSFMDSTIYARRTSWSLRFKASHPCKAWHAMITRIHSYLTQGVSTPTRTVTDGDILARRSNASPLRSRHTALYPPNNVLRFHAHPNSMSLDFSYISDISLIHWAQHGTIWTYNELGIL